MDITQCHTHRDLDLITIIIFNSCGKAKRTQAMMSTLEGQEIILQIYSMNNRAECAHNGVRTKRDTFE